MWWSAHKAVKKGPGGRIWPLSASSCTAATVLLGWKTVEKIKNGILGTNEGV